MDLSGLPVLGGRPLGDHPGYGLRHEPGAVIAHQRLVVAVASQLDRFFETSACEVLVAPFDLVLAEEGQGLDAASTVVQPDLAVVCDASLLGEATCVGAPTWILEVLSPSTAAKDHIQKRLLYERHGVAHYWLLHPEDRLITCYDLDAEGHFGPAQILEALGTLPVHFFPGLELDWQKAFRRLRN